MEPASDNRVSSSSRPQSAQHACWIIVNGHGGNEGRLLNDHFYVHAMCVSLLHLSESTYCKIGFQADMIIILILTS